VHILTPAPAGEFDVVARVPYIEKAIATVTLGAPATRELTVVIGRTEDLVGGVVLDLHGNPVAGAIVDTAREGAPSPTQGGWCVTNASGRFAFHRREGMTGSQLPLVVVDGLADAGIADYETPIALAWGEWNHVLATAPRRHAQIQVVDGSGQPIADFSVRTQSRSAYGTVSRSVDSRGAGVVELALPTGRSDVLVIPLGPHPPIWGRLQVDAHGQGHALFEVNTAVVLRGSILGGPPDLVDHEIEVTLTAQEHKEAREAGAANMHGVLVSPQLKEDLAVRTSVRDRRFEFSCDPGSRYILRVVALGHPPVDREIRANNGEFAPVAVELAVGATLNATIQPRAAVAWLREYAKQRGDDPQNQIGAFLLVKQGGASRNKTRILASPTTDGQLAFRGVSPGVWLLRAITMYRTELIRSIEVGTETTLELAPIDLSHLEPGHVSGICTWPQGVRGRLLNVRVRDGGEFDVALTRGGRFEFFAPAGSYLIGLSMVGETNEPLLLWDARVLDLRAGSAVAASLKVELERLQIRIVDDASGRGISGARLSIDEERATRIYKSFETGEGGIVDIFPCPLGEFGLSIWDGANMTWKPIARIQGTAVNPLHIKVNR
jgi:hypothetical protein